MVRFRCIILNTLHKDDNKDDDDDDDDDDDNNNIPVIIGATGRVTKGLKENVEAIPGKHSTVSLQMTAILGT